MKIYVDEKDSDLGGLRQVKRTTPDGYRYIPLDVPKFKFKQKTLNTFKNNTVFDTANSSVMFSIEESYKYDPWTFEVLTERDPYQAFDLDKPNPFTARAKEKYPELIQFLMNSLPFEHFFYVQLINPHRDIFPHIDNNYLHYQSPKNLDQKWHLQVQSFAQYMLENEPCSYHILINGKRENSFYIAEKFESREKSRENRDWSHIETDLCELPMDTDVFATMYTDSPHGVKNIKNDPNRLSVYLLGKVIPDNHKKLIEKSIEKFPNHCKLR